MLGGRVEVGAVGILAVMVVVWLVLRFCNVIVKILRPSGIDVLTRIAGLLCAAIAVQLIAVLREALSNVVRHAGASRVTVTVAVTPTDLVATVIDDGVGAGPGERPGGKGLARLRR